MSLLNSTDNIDWDGWEQGRRIKEDLERSKDFFGAMQRRQERFDEYEKEREMQQRNENARKAQEYLKRQAAERKAKEELERSCVNTFSNVQKQKGINYTLGDYISDLFDSFAYIPPLP